MNDVSPNSSPSRVGDADTAGPVAGETIAGRGMTDALRVVDSAKDDRVPLPAIALTAAGALPFMALAAAPWLELRPFGRAPFDVLGLYALGILSFMGAIHWGLAMSRKGTDETWNYVASVLPALLGWFALAFLPPVVAIRVTAAGFALLLLYDIRASRLGAAPVWYPRLRVPVTLVVVTSLLIASTMR